MFEDFRNAFYRPNNAHVQLIIINVVVFLMLFVVYMVTPDAIFVKVYEQFSIPSGLDQFIRRPWTLVTYMFTHSMWDIFHIIFNMLMFYWFGRLFVEYLGSDKLIAVYVMGGLAGGVLYLLIYNISPAYFEHSEMVGASGAIFAVVVAAATLLPNHTFFLLLLGPVRIKYIALFYVLLSALYVRQGVNLGGNLAHLGGAMLGFVYTKQLQQGSNWGAWVTAFLDWVKDLFKPRPKVKVTYRSESKQSKPKQKAKSADKVSQDEIDAILDKISAGGYESLTREEKEKLFNASKK